MRRKKLLRAAQAGVFTLFLLVGTTALAQQSEAQKVPSTPPGEKIEQGSITVPWQMIRGQMEVMAKLKSLLAAAGEALEAGKLETASAKIAAAQDLTGQYHTTAHRHMRRMMHRDEGSGTKRESMTTMKCPMCNKMMSDPAAVVNVRCPIMGTKIDPENVPDNLTRTFKGKSVGFCCPGCPAKWDKLSDAEKAKKLEAAMPKPGGQTGRGPG